MFAHGVFVYLPVIVTFGYLEEAIRVLTTGGLLVFDCFIAKRFGIDTIRQWQNDPYNYKFPTTISQSLISEFAVRFGLTIAGTFEVNYHASSSTYFILRKSPLCYMAIRVYRTSTVKLQSQTLPPEKSC